MSQAPPGHRKRSLPLDKARWHPSVLPGQVVLVSTRGADGTPNVAPKSWITMVAFAGPLLAFGCNLGHRTYQNAVANGEFVVNVPDASLAERIWAMADLHGAERLRLAGIRLVPAQRVAPPLVEECRAHLECVLERVNMFGDEVLVVGRVVALSVDEACLQGSTGDQYAALRPLFFLEEGLYGVVDAVFRVGERSAVVRSPQFVVRADLPASDTDRARLLAAHAGFLDGLRASGRLVGQSDLDGEERPACGAPATAYVFSAPSSDDAETLARADPLVRAGGSYSIQSWRAYDYPLRSS